MSLKFFTTLLCLVIFTSINAQSNEGTTSKLCINVNPKDATVKINNTVYDLGMQQLPLCIDLQPGTYTIELWHPHFQPLLDTLEVKSKAINKYDKSIQEVNPDLRTFKNRMTLIIRKRVSALLFPPCLLQRTLV